MTARTTTGDADCFPVTKDNNPCNSRNGQPSANAKTCRVNTAFSSSVNPSNDGIRRYSRMIPQTKRPKINHGKIIKTTVHICSICFPPSINAPGSLQQSSLVNASHGIFDLRPAHSQIIYSGQITRVGNCAPSRGAQFNFGAEKNVETQNVASSSARRETQNVASLRKCRFCPHFEIHPLPGASPPGRKMLPLGTSNRRRTLLQ